MFQATALSSPPSCTCSPGMSMFSTRNGLYEKARKQFKISDGIKLFTYSFYKANREAVQVGLGMFTDSTARGGSKIMMTLTP